MNWHWPNTDFSSFFLGAVYGPMVVSTFSWSIHKLTNWMFPVDDCWESPDEDD